MVEFARRNEKNGKKRGSQVNRLTETGKYGRIEGNKRYV